MILFLYLPPWAIVIPDIQLFHQSGASNISNFPTLKLLQFVNLCVCYIPQNPLSSKNSPTFANTHTQNAPSCFICYPVHFNSIQWRMSCKRDIPRGSPTTTDRCSALERYASRVLFVRNHRVGRVPNIWDSSGPVLIWRLWALHWWYGCWWRRTCPFVVVLPHRSWNSPCSPPYRPSPHFLLHHHSRNPPHSPANNHPAPQ
mmetsp:Transcript_43764/g.44234  ORF Transcript_43764/g.44234 Transcript_43764/m.44234 type:complete len:201 (-) Transcript_43764:74-676(-)